MFTPIDRSTIQQLTVGDHGITLTGKIAHAALKGVANTSGMSLKVDLLHAEGGPNMFTTRTAVIGALNTTDGTIAVSYRLIAGDVGTPGLGRLRWTLTLADGGDIHAPGPLERQTYLQINP